MPAAIPSSNESESSLYRSHLVSANDVADDPVTPASIASTSASKLAAGSTRLTSPMLPASSALMTRGALRSEEHTSELQSHVNLVCRLLLEKKKKMQAIRTTGNHYPQPRCTV